MITQNTVKPNIIKPKKCDNTILKHYIHTQNLPSENKSTKGKITINNPSDLFLTTKNYYDLHTYTYNMNHLKILAKKYYLTTNCNKQELTDKIYSYLYLSFFATKIQRLMRSFLLNKFISFYGPAFIKRTICTNKYDFITLEPVDEIDSFQFISYKNDSGIIYGFDIISLCTSFFEKRIRTNPYDRADIPENIIKNILKI
jgi:hypothetical protein